MNESTRSESEIIVMAQEGCADAFGELYQLHLDAISRYIQRRVSEIDEVENLTQTVFVKAWQAMARYQPSKAPFRAWLYRIAGNTVIDYYRTHKETVDIDAQWALTDGRRSPEEIAVAAERDASVRSAIDRLRPSYQQVISLRFLDEYDYPETAQALDRQVNAIRVLQHRALGAMRKVLSEEQVLWLVAAAAALTLALGGGVAVAAEGALPGDLLYPVKRAVESSRLQMADDEREVALSLAFANKRVDELTRSWAAGRNDDLAASVAFYADHVTDALVAMSKLAEADSEKSQALAGRASIMLSAQAEALATLASQGADTLQDAVELANEARAAMNAMQAVPPEAPSPEPAERGDAQPMNRTDAAPLIAGAMSVIEEEHGLPETDARGELEHDLALDDVDGGSAVGPPTDAKMPTTNHDALDSFPEPRIDGVEQAVEAPVSITHGETAKGTQPSPSETGPRLNPDPEQIAASSQTDRDGTAKSDDQRSDADLDSLARRDTHNATEKKQRVIAIPPLPNEAAPAIGPTDSAGHDEAQPRRQGDQTKPDEYAAATTDAKAGTDKRPEHSGHDAQHEAGSPLPGREGHNPPGERRTARNGVVDSENSEQRGSDENRQDHDGSVTGATASHDDQPQKERVMDTPAESEFDRSPDAASDMGQQAIVDDRLSGGAEVESTPTPDRHEQRNSGPAPDSAGKQTEFASAHEEDRSRPESNSSSRREKQRTP